MECTNQKIIKNVVDKAFVMKTVTLKLFGSKGLMIIKTLDFQFSGPMLKTIK